MTTLDRRLRDLVDEFGADEVRASLSRLGAKRRGPKKKQDWSTMHQLIVRDALDWLDGKDPFRARSNYWLAKQTIRDHPGQSRASSLRRVMRKLSKKRRFYTFLAAYNVCLEGRPHGDFLRVLSAIANERPGWGEILWPTATTADEVLRLYRDAIGEPDASKLFGELVNELVDWQEARQPIVRGLGIGSVGRQK